MKKTTQELLDLMKNSRSYDTYLEENRADIGKQRMRISAALSACLAEKQLSKAEVIARSGIETHYAYQIFSGAKEPSRDKVIMLCLGLALTADETQQLLKVTGYAQLYGRDARDNALLFALVKGMSVIAANELLYDRGLNLLM